MNRWLAPLCKLPGMLLFKENVGWYLRAWPSQMIAATIASFNIPPGLYYLRAAYRAFDMPETGLGSALTYYPGVATPQEASKIQVRAGRELTGMDMTLSEAEAFSVSGRVIGPDGKPFPNAYIHVVQFPWGEIITGNNWAQSNVGGEFRLKGLFPGKYLITAGAERDEKTAGQQSDR